MVVKKINFSGAFGAGQTVALQDCNFGLIAKPISEGAPVVNDFDNEKYLKWNRRCFSHRSDANNQYQADFIHVDEILKFVVDLGWDLFIAVLNGGPVTNPFIYWVRLFVKYI